MKPKLRRAARGSRPATPRRMRFFAKVKDKDDLDACVAVLEPEDVRAEFDQAFRRFGQSLDMLLPDPRALPYVRRPRWLGKIRQAAPRTLPRRPASTSPTAATRCGS